MKTVSILSDLKLHNLHKLQSRCQSIDLTPPLTGCKKRIDIILESEGVSVDKKQDEQIAQFIKNTYPDLRKVINELQKFCKEKKLAIKDNTNCDTFAKNIITLIDKGAVLKLRKHIIENEDKFNSDYPALLRSS